MTRRRLALGSNLRRALERNELGVLPADRTRYQNQFIGMEALIPLDAS
jgi:hypothetical protein